MPDFFDLIGKWWKQILTITALAIVVAVVVTLITPKKYLAVATAAPASSFASDRSRLFSENIEALYSVLGTADDLDLVIGTSKLDTVYLAVVDELKLADQYKVSEQGEARRVKVASIIKNNSKVQKSGYGELKIQVWDKDNERSASIANSILTQLRNIHQELQTVANRNTLTALASEKERLITKTGDSTGTSDFDELIRQYQFLVNNKPPVLLTIEQARVPYAPDQPKMFRNILAAAALAFFFSVLLALVLQKRKANS